MLASWNFGLGLKVEQLIKVITQAMVAEQVAVVSVTLIE